MSAGRPCCAWIPQGRFPIARTPYSQACALWGHAPLSRKSSPCSCAWACDSSCTGMPQAQALLPLSSGIWLYGLRIPCLPASAFLICTSAKALSVSALIFPVLKQRFAAFLTERNENGQFRHRRLRSAFSSIKNNLQELFTFQGYPILDIPTTNTCEGYSGQLKRKARVHSGLTKKHLKKVIIRLLLGR